MFRFIDSVERYEKWNDGAGESGTKWPTKKSFKKYAWKHRFVCLAWMKQPKVPTTDIEIQDAMREAKKIQAYWSQL